MGTCVVGINGSGRCRETLVGSNVTRIDSEPDGLRVAVHLDAPHDTSHVDTQTSMVALQAALLNCWLP